MSKHVLPLALLIAWWNRRRLVRIARMAMGSLSTVADWLQGRQNTMGRYARSVVTPFVLIGLVVIFLNVSLKMTILCFLLLVASTYYQLDRLYRKRIQMRTAAGGTAGETGGGSQA